MDNVTDRAPLRVDMQAGKPPVRVPRLPRGRRLAVLVVSGLVFVGMLQWLSPGTVTALKIGFYLLQGIVCLILAAVTSDPQWRIARVPARLVLAAVGAALLVLAVVEIRAELL